MKKLLFLTLTTLLLATTASLAQTRITTQDSAEVFTLNVETIDYVSLGKRSNFTWIIEFNHDNSEIRTTSKEGQEVWAVTYVGSAKSIDPATMYQIIDSKGIKGFIIHSAEKNEISLTTISSPTRETTMLVWKILSIQKTTKEPESKN